MDKKRAGVIKLLILAVVLVAAIITGFLTGAIQPDALASSWAFSADVLLAPCYHDGRGTVRGIPGRAYLGILQARGTSCPVGDYKIIRSLLKYAAAIVILCWGLTIIGVNITVVLASVGVLTLIVGFSAESLIADLVTGLFMLFENQYNVGDIVEIGGFRGTVTDIGIRTTSAELSQTSAAGRRAIFISAPISRAVPAARSLTARKAWTGSGRTQPPKNGARSVLLYRPRSNGGCYPMQTGSCSCFPTRTWMYFRIIRIMRASHGKRAPCAPGSMGTARLKTPAATAGMIIRAIILSAQPFRRKSRRPSQIQRLSMTITRIMAQRAATTPPIKSFFCRLQKQTIAATLPITAAVFRPIPPM